MRAYIHVNAFIDWNSQLRQFAKDDGKVDSVNVARSALNYVFRRLADKLYAIAPDLKFKVSLRLYHGWHKGFQPSQNKVAISKVIAEIDFAVASPRPNVVFSEAVGYGDCLVAALPTRLHPRLSIHLPNTLRDRASGVGVEEKMVDTALASDMVVTAFKEPDEWIVVVTEDDDIVPPIFAVEAIKDGGSSRVLLVSQRKRSAKFMDLKGVEC